MAKLPVIPAPSGLVPDIAGPRAYEMKELIRSYLRATDRYRLIVTWEEFLAERAA